MNLVSDFLVSNELIEKFHLFMPFQKVLLKLELLLDLKSTDYFIHVTMKLDFTLTNSLIFEVLWTESRRQALLDLVLNIFKKGYHFFAANKLCIAGLLS